MILLVRMDPPNQDLWRLWGLMFFIEGGFISREYFRRQAVVFE
jgi:hypothetical protein